MGRLDGKTAIITGASAGMGSATAKLFAKEGANVIALARRMERLEKLSAEAEGTIVPFAGDITNDADIENVVKLAIEKFGSLDILVNNAGIMDNMTSAAEITNELWDKVINVNLTSLMKFTRGALKEMLNANQGVIINIASLGGIKGGMAGSAYIASKHGVVGYTKSVAFEYAQKGIRCNVICPGAVKTEIAEAGLSNVDPFGMERARIGMGTIPRQGEPEEIASIVLFLASDESSFVNGAVIAADAGWAAY
jgi:Short-chain alcohol dehydrogenase of unknown specificity